MAYLEFNSALHVGNRLMDREHAVLIEYINSLQKAVDEASSRYLVGQVLEGLVEYTKTHFFVEEEMMRVYAYPDYSNHKKAHDAFKREIQKHVDSYRSGEGNVTEAVMFFLKDWLVNHIMKIDVQLAGFLKDKSLS